MDIDNGSVGQPPLISMPNPDALPVPEPGPSGGAPFSQKLDLTDMAEALPDFQGRCKNIYSTLKLLTQRVVFLQLRRHENQSVSCA